MITVNDKTITVDFDENIDLLELATKIAMRDFGTVVPEEVLPVEIPRPNIPKRMINLAQIHDIMVDRTAGEKILEILRSPDTIVFKKDWRTKTLRTVSRDDTYDCRMPTFLIEEFYPDAFEHTVLENYLDAVKVAKDVANDANKSRDEAEALIENIHKALLAVYAERESEKNALQRLTASYKKMLRLSDGNETIAQSFFIDQYSEAQLEHVLESIRLESV